MGVPTMRDDPKLVWFEHAGQIQNDRLYKENYHKTKAKIHIPPDMVSVLAAKEGQALASDIDYRNYLHQWICHPDQNDVIQARKAYDLQSDVSDFCLFNYYGLCRIISTNLEPPVFETQNHKYIICSQKGTEAGYEV